MKVKAKIKEISAYKIGVIYENKNGAGCKKTFSKGKI